MKHALPLLASLVLATNAAAQAINFDCGTYNASPSNAYGAASGQTGFWDNVSVLGPTPLLDTSGAAGSVVVNATAPQNSSFSFGANNPLTHGDDQLLLDGGHDGPLTMDFSGLAPGDYNVYTYAWAPDMPLVYTTYVSVAGSPDPMQQVGGVDFSNGHVQGGTYAKHRFTVTNGTLQIVCTAGINATINGVQIEPAGAPPVIYCTAKANSLGCTPTIASAGTASATSGSGFLVNGANVRNQKSGLLFYGMNGRNNTPFQGGTLCVATPIKRTPAVTSGGSALPTHNCTGVYSIDMNAFAVGAGGGSPDPLLTVPGTVVDCQYWGRDPGFPSPNNTTLTDGLEYTVGP